MALKVRRHSRRLRGAPSFSAGVEFLDEEVAGFGGDEFEAFGGKAEEVVERGDEAVGGGADVEVEEAAFPGLAVVEGEGDLEAAVGAGGELRFVIFYFGFYIGADGDGGGGDGGRMTWPEVSRKSRSMERAGMRSTSGPLGWRRR